MKHITYKTEKAINRIKRIPSHERTMAQELAVIIWDNIFSSCGYYGAPLKELESYLGRRLDNTRQESVPYLEGIHGIEYATDNNIRYIGTHDLSHVNIDDFNKFIQSL